MSEGGSGRRSGRARPLPVRLIGTYGLLAIGSVLVAFPLLLALAYSFMSESEIATFPPTIVPSKFRSRVRLAAALWVNAEST